MTAQLRKQLFDRNPAATTQFTAHLWTLRKMDRDRLRYALQLGWLHLLKPNELDRALLALPSGLAFLYYFLRPLRVLWQYGSPRRFLQRLRLSI